MVDLTNDSCCLLWLSVRLKPKEEKNNGAEFDFGFDGPKPKLRVDYRFASSAWQTFVPEHKSVPDNSMLYSITNSAAAQACLEDWSDLKLGDVSIEAVRSQHSEPSTLGVMALLSQPAAITRS